MIAAPQVASREEIERSWTLVDVVIANEVLDVKNELEYLETEKAKSNGN